MSIPLILLVGQSNSGKDTVAHYLVNKYQAVSIAQADPIKRFCKYLFDFTDLQLWGPSEERNGIDTRFGLINNRYGDLVGNDTWKEAFKKLDLPSSKHWVKEVIGQTSNFSVREVRGVAYSVNLDHEFAYGKLREWLFKLFDVYKESGLSPRLALQTLGAEYGRNLNRDIWVKYALRCSMDILGGGYRYSNTNGVIVDEGKAPPQMVAITDGRFVNEVLEIAKINGQIWKIECPQAKNLQGGIANHSSEQEQKLINHMYFNQIINNDKSLGFDNLFNQIDSILNK